MMHLTTHNIHCASAPRSYGTTALHIGTLSVCNCNAMRATSESYSALPPRVVDHTIEHRYRRVTYFHIVAATTIGTGSCQGSCTPSPSSRTRQV